MIKSLLKIQTAYLVIFPIVANTNKSTSLKIKTSQSLKIQMVQESKILLKEKIVYVGNLCKNVEFIDIYDLFSLNTTTYLRDNCRVHIPYFRVHIPQLQSNGRHKRYAYIKTSIHVFDEIVELNGLNFSLFCNNFINVKFN